MQQSAERLRLAEDRARKAERRLHEVRPTRTRDLERADSEEIRLKELTRKLSQWIGTMEPADQKAAEQEIVNAQAEISARRREAMEELDATLKESDAARRELKAARDAYQQLRRELDQIMPHMAGNFSSEDKLAREAEAFFPAGQIQALAREIADGESHFGMLDQKEQFAQLKIWIGRFRRLQAWAESGAGDALGLSDEDHMQLREIFPRLVGISKQYMPGYIEAFSRSFETDWDAYVGEAEEQMRLAVEGARRDKEMEQRRRDVQAREQERLRLARQTAQTALDELKGVIARFHLPEEGANEFRNALARVTAGMGTSEPQLLELVRPFADLLDGKEFRALRRNLDRVDPDEARRQENEALREQFQDLVTATRGLHVLMIGGSVREEARRSLLQVFDFEELEWEPYESARPVMLKSLEQRVRNRGMDLLLILKEFVGHHVSEILRPLCQEYGIPCLMVEHGYGAAQVAESLRKGLPKIARVVAKEGSTS
jgi:hypothetical protein